MTVTADRRDKKDGKDGKDSVANQPSLVEHLKDGAPF